MNYRYIVAPDLAHSPVFPLVHPVVMFAPTTTAIYVLGRTNTLGQFFAEYVGRTNTLRDRLIYWQSTGQYPQYLYRLAINPDEAERLECLYFHALGADT